MSREKGSYSFNVSDLKVNVKSICVFKCRVTFSVRMPFFITQLIFPEAHSLSFSFKYGKFLLFNSGQELISNFMRILLNGLIGTLLPGHYY